MLIRLLQLGKRQIQVVLREHAPKGPASECIDVDSLHASLQHALCEEISEILELERHAWMLFCLSPRGLYSLTGRTAESLQGPLVEPVHIPVHHPLRSQILVES